MTGASRSSLLVIAGLSGAGKSTALRALADLGYYVIDNLPVPLFNEFVAFMKCGPEKYFRTAVLPDIDSRDRLSDLLSQLEPMYAAQCGLELMFFDCQTETIVRRYSETRRPHPGFDPQRDRGIEDAIDRERSRFVLFKDRANYRIDTTNLNVHELKRLIKDYVEEIIQGTVHSVRVNFVSFGFKHGIPLDCDLVMDVRFLPNPYFVAELRDQSGLERSVVDYVFSNTAATTFVDKFADMLDFLLPQYLHEGKAYINIGIGCTGGRHRSVALAQALYDRVHSADCLFSVKHRDIDR